MIAVAKIYFLLFGFLTIAGGLVGYFKAGSLASIMAGSVSGVLLLVSAFLLPQHHTAGLLLALIISVLLALQFVPKFFTTGKFMPAGIMALLSVLAVILAIAVWLKE